MGPKEARVLAQRARDAGLAPGAARALLAYLLRVCDPRQGFTRAIPHHSPADDRMTGLTEELGVSLSTLIRAVHALERAGLVSVVRGTGRSWSRYTLEAAQVVELLGELPGSPWVTLAFTQGAQGCQNDTPGVSKRHPWGVKTTPPYVRARESDLSKTTTPPPPPAAGRPPGPGPEVSPPASGQGPLSSRIERSEQRSEQGSEHVPDPCQHGRTLAQGGCRICGTTARARAALDRQAAAQLELEARKAEQLRNREAGAAARARAAPAADHARTARQALRDAIHTSKQAPPQPERTQP